MRCQRMVESMIVGESGTFRRQCTIEGTCHPLIRMVTRDGSTAEHLCPIVLCDEHKDADPEVYLDEEFKAFVGGQFRAVACEPPVWERTRVEFVSLTDPRVVQLHAMGQPL